MPTPMDILYNDNDDDDDGMLDICQVISDQQHIVKFITYPSNFIHGFYVMNIQHCKENASTK